MIDTPLVSICCLSYNHAPFIRKCLDGFLMQQTDFPIEILIHDDASTDGTQNIIREFETKHPELFRITYESENKYSHGFKGKMDTEFCYKIARGKYVAYCEGDDYWTEPLKLQKQVDFMEAHPDYSICFHGFHRVYCNNEKPIILDITNKNKNENSVFDITVKDFLNNRYDTLPLTMLFRKSLYDIKWAYEYKTYRDTHQIYLLLKNGKGAYLQFDGAAHIKHKGGIYTSQSEMRHCLEAIDCFTELYHKNKNDKELKKHIIKVMRWSYEVSKISENKAELFKKFLQIFFIIPPKIIPVLLKDIYKQLIFR